MGACLTFNVLRKRGHVDKAFHCPVDKAGSEEVFIAMHYRKAENTIIVFYR